MARFWHLDPAFNDPPVRDAFSSLEATFALRGEFITSSPISKVQRIAVDDQPFFVKTYTAGGKNLRRWIGRSRVQAEWENLLFFQKLGIPTAPLVAYGKTSCCGIYQKGALVTAEVPNTKDLATMHEENHPLMQNAHWIEAVSRQLADYTRRLHRQGFGHLDLKWRNILATLEEKPLIYFIDCPAGQIRRGPLAQRWFIKDLACLDVIAKQRLSKTQRLRFYRDYRKGHRLSAGEKRQILKILHFFDDRR